MSVADETFACPRPLSSVSTSVQLDDFDIKPSEQKATEELSKLLKESTVPENLVDIKTFCGMLLPDLPTTECSNVVYMSVVDLHADSVEAMEAVISKLHKEYGVGESVHYLVLVGDQKTFSRIH